MKLTATIYFLLLMTTMSRAQTHHHKGYHHHLNRETKALSEQEVQGYLTGEGMGMALPAELNHYPGPRHVLDVADSLNLTEEQKVKTQETFDQMHAMAVQLGMKIVEKEAALDSLFSHQQADPGPVHELLIEIGNLNAELRWTHIQAHIQTRRILTPEQIAQYDWLRGYAGF